MSSEDRFTVLVKDVKAFSKNPCIVVEDEFITCSKGSYLLVSVKGGVKVLEDDENVVSFERDHVFSF